MFGLFFAVFGALFSVANPLGTMPMYIGLTEDSSMAERKVTAMKASLYFLLILSVAFWGGKYVIQFFGISIDSLRIGGGLIISSSGFALLTGNFSKHKGMSKQVKEDAYTREDPSMTPLAMPMLAGPGSISLLISLHEEYAGLWNSLVIYLTIPAVGIATYLILRSSAYLSGKLGASGLNAISRIIGFIVIAIGIEYILTSVRAIVNSML
ncbi:MAG: MarC family protein [Bacteroidales bacterium]|jgi:multiple antibiotic resistance protein